MRFTAEYDSEEEEYPVDDAGHEYSPKTTTKTVQYEEWSSDDEEGEEVDFFDVSFHHSPRANQDAWVFPTYVLISDGLACYVH
jgi:hypothetical protein